MTDETEEKRSRGRRNSIVYPPTISEQPSRNSTISNLVNSTPLLDPNGIAGTPNNSTTPRPRRRSSFSIIQALIGSNALLSTNEARKR